MTQFTLKCIALLCMLSDHFAKVVLSTGALSPALGMEGQRCLYTVLTTIGRMAFPMFAWFAAEGCRKTGNMKKYLLRLLLCALLSEVPFQLCFYDGLTLGCHNVVFTIALAALGIFGGRLLERTKLPAWAAGGIPAVLAVALGFWLHTDYNGWGVALIMGLYYLPRGRLGYLTVWLTVFYLIWHGWNGESFLWRTAGVWQLLLQWLGALMAVPLLLSYNGEKGRGGKGLFYVFYPVHLLALWGLAALVSQGYMPPG